MIVKIPIYVEVGPVSADQLVHLVEMLNKNFTVILRKSKTTKIQMLHPTTGKKVTSLDYEIISREKANDFLRTGK